MATTNEWYQRSVRDYEDKVRDYSADLAFLNEQIQTANTSIADLRRRRFNAADDEEVEVLTEQINNVTSRRNGLELRQADTFNALQSAESSLTQARADLARVNQGAPAQTQPLQPPAAPAADPASRQAQAPVDRQNSQLTNVRTAQDVTDPGEVPGVTVSDRLQTDPGEVPGETVFGPSFVTDPGVPTQQLRNTPTPVPAPAIEDDIEGGAVGFPEGTFAGNGYGFTYDEDGELIPSDSADAERIRSTPADTEDEFAGNGYGFEYNEDGELIPAEDPFAPDSFDANDVTPDSDPALDTGRFAAGSADDGYPVTQPDPPLDLTYEYNEVDGYDIFDENGQYITTVPTEQDAILYVQNAGAAGLGIADSEAARINEEAAAAQAEGGEDALDAAGVEVARDQFTLQQRNNTTTLGDWRVIIRLLPGASYLYKDSANTLLQPLRDSDGVVFPYTPTITTNYVARYDPYELTHANYRGFFYKNSHVGEIQLNGVFTAQDTAEANYLLAVIHFFRSCTKMFYGQDSEFRGSPPPLVELSGYGEFQFNNHPCVVSNFNYTLPNNVDYIRVTGNNQGLNLSPRQNPISTGGGLTSILTQLQNLGIPPGAEPARRQDLGFVQGVNGTGQTSYVPTKMEIQLTLLPVQTREQVSKGFRLDEFARGNLLRGGFW